MNGHSITPPRRPRHQTPCALRAPIKRRSDLPFTRRDDKGRLQNWAVPHDTTSYWSQDIKIGHAMFAAWVKLAEHNPQEAIIALQMALNSGGWKTEGWGIEMGFSEMLAHAAVAGVLAGRRAP